MNKDDAKQLKIKDNSKILIESSVGKLTSLVKLDDGIPTGLIATHFHFEKLLVNKLVPLEFDNETFTPNYKAVAVSVKRIK